MFDSCSKMKFSYSYLFRLKNEALKFSKRIIQKYSSKLIIQ